MVDPQLITANISPGSLCARHCAQQFIVCSFYYYFCYNLPLRKLQEKYSEAIVDT